MMNGVAGPGVALQGFKRRGVEAHHGPARLAGEEGEEALGEQRDIFLAAALGRQIDAHAAQGVEEVDAELAGMRAIAASIVGFLPSFYQASRWPNCKTFNLEAGMELWKTTWAKQCCAEKSCSDQHRHMNLPHIHSLAPTDLTDNPRETAQCLSAHSLRR